MANNLTKLASAGLDRMFAGLVDSDGIFAGNDATPSNGTDNGGWEVLGPNIFNITIPPLEKVNVTGNDGLITSFQFESDAETTVEFETGVGDMDVAAAADGKTLDVIDTNYTLFGLRPGLRTPQTMWITLNMQAKSQASGSLGVAHWLNMFFKGEVSLRNIANIQNKGAHSWQWSVNIVPSDTYPWGEATADGDTYAAWIWASEYRMRLHRHQGDNSDDEMVLSDVPVSLAKVSLWTNASILTRTTNYTLSGSTVTFDAGSVPGTGVDSVAWYEFTR